MAKVIGNALPVGGVYNATPPTGVDENIIPLQVDEDGNLKVAGIASGSSSASSIGGGNAIYSNTQGDFTATANSGAETITFSAYANAVLSAVIGNINFLNGVIKRRSSAGIVDTLPLTNVSFASNVLTLSDMSANFAVGDTVAVYVTGPDKAFDATANAQKTREQYSPVAEDNTAGVMGNILKPVNSSTYAPSNYHQPSTHVTKANVKASPGNVYSLRVTNENAAARWFQLHNKASAPAATEVPVRSWKIGAGSGTAPTPLILDSKYFAPSHYCTTGIGWAISTTELTFTDSATASEHEVEINYV